MDIPEPKAQILRAMLREGRYRDALELAEQISNDCPASSYPHMISGVCLRALNRYDEALARLEVALALSPRNAAILANLGFAYEALNLLDKSARHLTMSLEIDAANTKVRAALGRIHYKLGNLELCASCLGHPDLMHDLGLEEVLTLANVLSAQGKDDDSVSVLIKHLETSPQDSRLYLALGTQHLKMSRASEAIKVFELASTRFEDAELFNNYGVALRKLGRNVQALDQFRRALMINPRQVDALINVGSIELESGSYASARSTLTQSLSLAPKRADATLLLGELALQEGDYLEATKLLERACTLLPSKNTYTALAKLKLCLGDRTAALNLLEHALRCSPQDTLLLARAILIAIQQGAYARARQLIGSVSFASRDEWGMRFCAEVLESTTAEKYLREAKLSKLAEEILSALKSPTARDQAYSYIELLSPLLLRQGMFGIAESLVAYGQKIRPANGALSLLMARVYKAQGNAENERRNLTAALGDSSVYFDAALSLTALELAAGDIDMAGYYGRLALERSPRDPRAINNYLLVCLNKNSLYEGAQILGESEGHIEFTAELLNTKGLLLKELGQAKEASVSFLAAHERNQEDPTIYSNFLYNGLYSWSGNQQFFEAAQRFDVLYGGPIRLCRLSSEVGKPRRRIIRIAYLSADYRDHAVSYFIEQILVHHNRIEFSIYAYSNNPKKDHVTERLMGYVDHWCDCFAMSDDQLAQRIVDDEIDILVDLSGHTAGNRLPVFARKPAPVQVTWIGFPGTTGLKAMDYRITDEWFDPPGMTEKYHTETLVRLPHTNGCYRPDERSPEVNQLPALGKGTFTFASLNNPCKINDEVIATWARILTKVPHGRLMLGNANDEAMVTRLTEKFSALGVRANQLAFQKRMDFLQYMALHHEIDLALDPFPYNGGTTTFHSLYMGVPVVTLAGQTTSSRCGVAILSQVQLHDFVAKSLDQYVDTAVGWAGKPKALDAIRQSLRSRLNAPENQAKAVVGHLENAYKEMWSTFCKSVPSVGQVNS